MQHEPDPRTALSRDPAARNTRSAAEVDAERRRSIAAYKMMSQQERLRRITGEMLADMKPDGDEFNRRFVARRQGA